MVYRILFAEEYEKAVNEGEKKIMNGQPISKLQYYYFYALRNYLSPDMQSQLKKYEVVMKNESKSNNSNNATDSSRRE